MKLAEALAARADAQRRLAQLIQRIQLAARHQEGEAPPEDPVALLEEARRVLDELERLIRTINATNGRAELEPGVTLTDALAKRDVLAKRRELLVEAANAASLRHDRYMRSESASSPRWTSRRCGGRRTTSPASTGSWTHGSRRATGTRRSRSRSGESVVVAIGGER